MSIFLGSVKKNIRTIEITIESESFLKLIKKTPAFKDLFYDKQLKELQVGKNIIDVNNFVYSKLDNFGLFNVKKIK
jgi:hypothetical protein